MSKIKKYRHLIKEEKTNPEEIIRNSLKSIKPELNAWITVAEKAAIAKSRKFRGELMGIPIAIKDNIHVRNIATTCGSRILHDFIPPFSATVCDRIEDMGGIILGKTNMDEFAMGSSTENSFFGATINPHDRNRVPGGSSGGSAVAVAVGSAFVALGSDTGGSVRQPAAYCGIVGLKPTYGRVSRYGLVAFASSLDQIGIMGCNSTDVGLILNCIAGRDVKDSTSVDRKLEDYSSFDNSLKSLEIGIPEEYLNDIDEQVYNSTMEIKSILEKEGVRFKSITLPSTEYVISTYQVIASAEASSNLARYDGVRYGYREEGENFKQMIRKTRNKGFMNEVKRRILVGTFVLSSEAIGEYYERAQKVRTVIKNEIDEAFKDVDYILTPTTPSPAFRLGERKEDPLKMHLSDRFTAAANLSGIPAISAPAGYSSNNLPLSYQLMGKPFDEKGLLNLVNSIEKIKPFQLPSKTDE